ncbi:hypothetical protein AVEN_111886-1 [Araneus ventricosus]|uniref:Uncharacterized protein n=1 Tax=Araneus ventricosus TaxID=182803 RepID=A0A4Y2QYV7_ARAVE|nr:hypothetical protein AVEN_111886-1 [Araneus ventricosus]
MTRTTPELAPSLQTSITTEGRLATTYDLACSRPHTRRIFSGIGFRTLRPQSRDLTTRPPRPWCQLKQLNGGSTRCLTVP